MRVSIVREATAHCTPRCAEWISAEGDIVDGTPAEFRRVLAQMGARRLPVFVNSGGGSIEAAIAIGEMLRQHGLDVSVTRTEFAGCAGKPTPCGPSAGPGRTQATGLPDSYNAYCASACTLVLAAGVQRLASPWSYVGVHQIVVFKTQYKVRRTYRVTTLARPAGGSSIRRTLIREQMLGSTTQQVDVNDDTYRPMRDYLAKLGVADTLVPLMEQTPNTSIHWMSRHELESTRLATSDATGDALLAPEQRQPATAILKVSKPVTSGRAVATFPAYLQGRPISMFFDAALDKQRSNISLAVTFRQGGTALRSEGLAVRFDFDGAAGIEGRNVDASAPYAPLEAKAGLPAVCPQHMGGTMHISVQEVPSSDGRPVQLQLRQFQPIALPVASVPGLAELLTAACSGVQTARN